MNTCRLIAAARWSMLWFVQDLLAMRLEFVHLAHQLGANVRQLCRRFGVSPAVAYKWLARFQADGADTLPFGARMLPAGENGFGTRHLVS